MQTASPSSKHPELGSEPCRARGFENKYVESEPLSYLPPTRVSSKGGTLLVQLVRRIEERKRRTLRSINLKQLGQYAVVPDDTQSSYNGQARASQHLLHVRVLPSALPAGLFTLAIVDGDVRIFLGNRRVHCSREPLVGGLDFIKADGSHDYIVQNESGDYFKLAVSGPESDVTIAASWSSNLSTLPDFLHDITNFVGNPSPERRAFLQMTTEKRASNVAATDALTFALKNPGVVQSLTLDYDDFSISWSRQPHYGAAGRLGAGESTIMIPADDIKLLELAVSATATSVISSNLKGILGKTLPS